MAACMMFVRGGNYVFWRTKRNYLHVHVRRVLVKASFVDCKTRSGHTEAEDVPASTFKEFKSKLLTGPSFEHFVSNGRNGNEVETGRVPLQESGEYAFDHPYVRRSDVSGNQRKVYFEVYGCQMNVNDTDIAWAILKKHGYTKTTNIRLGKDADGILTMYTRADVILVMTCAIREGAEQKVWNKLEFLKGLKRRRESSKTRPQLKIGILGCMAERLKHKLLEIEKMVDLVAGPDSYRDLPRMLAIAGRGQAAVNVLLSLDETYADVMPVQVESNSTSAFVSIMRGCDNMCSYCIVPFTRGRERSRPLESIVDEVRRLSDSGVKEVVLLGQNVNSYLEVSSAESTTPTRLSRGFSTLYRLKTGGHRFVDLLEKVADVNPEMRIRFTSPHPKDFPDEVLQLIKERPNICNQLHLPAQSGNNRVLAAMRRGYSRESYLDLVAHIRSIIPDIGLSSDFICGFCGETEDEFDDTLSMLQQVKYNFVYLFPYSMRERTHAYHKMVDDVPQLIKIERQNRMVAVSRAQAETINRRQIGQHQVVLVEGISKRSSFNLAGRNDHNTKVIFPSCEIPESSVSSLQRPILQGDYIIVQINDASSQVLKGLPLYHVTLKGFNSGYVANKSATSATML